MSASKRWVVTMTGDRQLNDVEQELTKTGFAVEQVLGEIGSITGTASDDIVERLRSVPGVADVSPDHPIDIGPPDAPVTW
jgi:hypothetical protein